MTAPVDMLLSMVDRVRQTQFIPGGVVGVVRPGPSSDTALTHVFPFGVTDVDTGILVDSHTGFEIGSLTKVFTAAVLASVCADPELPIDLHTELRQLTSTPVPALDGEAIRVEDLVTHRSGLPRLPLDGPRTPADRAGYRPDQLWAALAASRLLFRPGSSWLYSNFGFGILGTVLSELTGRSFAALAYDVVCRPLGLAATVLESGSGRSGGVWSRWFTRSGSTGRDEQAPRMATGYRKRGSADRIVAAPSWNNTGAMAGSGGLVSTGNDMTMFLAAATGYGPHSAAAALEQTRRRLPARGGIDRPQMAMAWQIRTTPRCGPVLFKNGGTSGMHCAMALLPRTSDRRGGHGVVVLTNGPDHVDELAVDLLETVIARSDAL